MFIKKKSILLSSTTFNKINNDGIYYYTKSIYDNLSNIYKVRKLTFKSNYNFWTKYPYSYYAVFNFITNINFKFSMTKCAGRLRIGHFSFEFVCDLELVTWCL